MCKLILIYDNDYKLIKKKNENYEFQFISVTYAQLQRRLRLKNCETKLFGQVNISSRERYAYVAKGIYTYKCDIKQPL